MKNKKTTYMKFMKTLKLKELFRNYFGELQHVCPWDLLDNAECDKVPSFTCLYHKSISFLRYDVIGIGIDVTKSIQ